MAATRTLLAITITLCAISEVSNAACSSSVAPVLKAMFSNLGSDCDAYVALYASNAAYYHQHQGYLNYSGLPAGCAGYASFCPGDACSFLQDGAPFVVQNGDRCEVLAPYVWSEFPANTGNLEPHTGFEHVTLIEDSSAKYAYLIETFREIETSYSVAYNWGDPSDSSAEHWTASLLNGTASGGECKNALQPFLTNYFSQTRSTADGSTLYRQQGDAVVLAAGGLCQLVVPYAAAIDGVLQTGRVALTLTPSGTSYTLQSNVTFPLSSLVEDEDEAEDANEKGTVQVKEGVFWALIAVLIALAIVVIALSVLVVRSRRAGGTHSSNVDYHPM